MAGAAVKELVRIFEVSPRDGLQNEKGFVSTEDKIELVDLLSRAGFPSIEVTSFVSPKWVPQMRDAAEVFAGITKASGISYAALAPNEKGAERAVLGGADEIAVFVSASETFSRKNTNCTIDEGLARAGTVVRLAQRSGLKVRGYVSCVIDCPYEGVIAPQMVRPQVERLLETGCYEVSLGDTIGRGTQEQVANLLDFLAAKIPARHLAGHFHDTGGHAVGNVECALGYGLRCFDSAMAGLGGCPYAPGAAGNLDTKHLVDALDRLGYGHGIDRSSLEAAYATARRIKQRASEHV
ncbi:MAG: hydroxymethylglutaryl-CoA lyase [Pseudomonadota bacterium]